MRHAVEGTRSEAVVTHSILNEQRRTLTEAARLLPGCKGKAHPDTATLTRWILRGKIGLDGRRVRLEAVKLGAWTTSVEAVERFVSALTACGVVATPPSPAERSRPGEQAGKELKAAMALGMSCGAHPGG